MFFISFVMFYFYRIEYNLKGLYSLNLTLCQSLFSVMPQEAWPMAVGVSSLQPQEPRPSTAAPPARAPPSFPPAASCSRHHGYATVCQTWCRRAGAACWRTSGTTVIPTCSSETSLATSWSSARISMAAGMHRQMPRAKKKNSSLPWA